MRLTISVLECGAFCRTRDGMTHKIRRRRKHRRRLRTHKRVRRLIICLAVLGVAIGGALLLSGFLQGNPMFGRVGGVYVLGGVALFGVDLTLQQMETFRKREYRKQQPKPCD